MARIGMRIGELSRRTGGNIETIRYYERIGLLPVPDRAGRYRRYDPDDVHRLLFIRRARALGFGLDEVRTLLRLAETDGRSACADARALAARHLADVEAKLADLHAMRQTLTATLRRCDTGEPAHCPLIEVLAANPPVERLTSGSGMGS